MSTASSLKDRLHMLFSRPEYVFILISLFFGSLSAFLVPQLSVTDEQMHYLRAYSLSELNVSTKNCTYPKLVADRTSSIQNGDFRSHYKTTVNTHERTNSDSDSKSCGSAASYNPIVHAPQAIGIAIAKLIHPSNGLMILFGRLANVAFYTVAIFLVIKYARVGKYAILVIASLPIMIHLSGSLSSDTFNNVVVIAFVSYVISLMTYKKSSINLRHILLLVCLTLLLSFTKLPNLALLTLLLLLPKNALNLHVSRIKLGKYSVIAIAVVIALASTYVWQKISNTGIIPVKVENPVNANPLYFVTILFNTYFNPLIGYTDVVMEGVIDFFSSFRYSLPNFVELIIWTTLGVSLFYKSTEPTIPRHTAKIAGILAMSTLTVLICAISYALYSAWAIQPFRFGPAALYADGVQGRYFTAFLVLLIPISLWPKRYININANSQYLIPLLITGSLIFSLTYYIITTYFFKISLP